MLDASALHGSHATRLPPPSFLLFFECDLLTSTIPTTVRRLHSICLCIHYIIFQLNGLFVLPSALAESSDLELTAQGTEGIIDISSNHPPVKHASDHSGRQTSCMGLRALVATSQLVRANLGHLREAGVSPEQVRTCGKHTEHQY